MKNNDNINTPLFISGFIIAFLGSILFPGNKNIFSLMFGLGFFLFGLAAMFSPKILSREDYPIFLFILVGLSTFELGLVGLIKEEYINIMIHSVISNSIILFGILILLFEAKNKLGPKKRRLFNFKTTEKGKIKKKKVLI